MSSPVVSILLPVYNGGRYLREALDSLFMQQFEDFEIIAVDDGSKDDTLAILNSYSDKRLIVVCHAYNKGIVATLNTGIAHCRGRLIARMDADDISRPCRLSKQVAYFQAHPKVGVVDTVQAVIDEKGRPVGRTNSPIVNSDKIMQTLPKLNCLGHPSVMVRSDLLRMYGYREVPYEDYDLWLRMAADGIPIVKLDDPLLLFRSHSSSITGTDAVNTRHFLKIIKTKRFYLSHLSFAESLKPFNLAVRIWLLHDLATQAYKKAKLLLRK